MSSITTLQAAVKSLTNGAALQESLVKVGKLDKAVQGAESKREVATAEFVTLMREAGYSKQCIPLSAIKESERKDRKPTEVAFDFLIRDAVIDVYYTQREAALLRNPKPKGKTTLVDPKSGKRIPNPKSEAGRKALVGKTLTQYRKRFVGTILKAFDAAEAVENGRSPNRQNGNFLDIRIKNISAQIEAIRKCDKPKALDGADAIKAMAYLEMAVKALKGEPVSDIKR